MRNLIYNGTKNIVKAGLHCYYKKIKIVGLENVPKDKPVLFLPNHQSALMDVLLIVTDCNRKPYFLTRSDIFGKPFLDAIFNFFRMIPIYRIRDGRDALSKNDAIFDKCAEILKGQETLVIFPEANHNLKRSVRPLSKGFTRILLRAMEKYPTLDIQLVPVGLNYKDAVGFPDEVSLYYGKPISLKSIYKETDLPYTVGLIKKHVTESLQRLTTHIPHDQNYDEIEKVLNTTNVNYLNPTETNNVIQKISQKPLDDATFLKKSSKEKTFLNYLFVVLNFPVLLVWRRFVEPKVWEPEFMATMRLAAAFVGYFLYYLLLLLLLILIFNFKIALIVVVLLFGFNWLYVK